MSGTETEAVRDVMYRHGFKQISLMSGTETWDVGEGGRIPVQTDIPDVRD
ncbi:hypothetical protein THER_1164 [Thermodesulfovibrio sp. N1]|nr:hypothetical protein THER_1164 [Thermodesulfovibrio sp. N1]